MQQIAGFGLAGFRSFPGGQLELLAPLDRVNLLAGQNNTGKSNVLRFAQVVLGRCHGAKDAANLATPADLDAPLGDTGSAPLELAIGLEIGEDDIEALSSDGRRNLTRNVLDHLRRVLESPGLRLTDDDLVWLRFQTERGSRGQSTLQLSEEQLAAVVAALDQQHLQALSKASSALTGTSGGGRTDDLKRVFRHFQPLSAVPPVMTIEAFRQVREGGDEASLTHNGEGLIEALARLERPDIARQSDQARFEAINRFVRTVLDDPDVRIEIPHHRETIHVHQEGHVLPLENLGTGVHQVVILAAAATLLTDHLVCMEEPEIHLHPILQRKLLRYLATETNNQYLIATHSAHMLDAEIAFVFHVTLTETGTKVRFAAHPKDQAAICADLGYRPSDLVQANAVIWVEGPSDRIYLRHWIGLLDPVLIEGVHYSIMFYGGRLLSHLSANDPDVQDFISLRRFNRHIAILIDSDKTTRYARINETKKRIRHEFDIGPGFAWVTKGYTIENYVPPDVLSDAVGAVHPGITARWAGEQYQNPLAKDLMRGSTSSVDKVATARACVERWRDTDWPHDLKQQTAKTVAFIRDANGLPAPGPSMER